ncbi:MAG: hypothetical protein AAFR46_01855 [Pseudomonadota bacterium]
MPHRDRGNLILGLAIAAIALLLALVWIPLDAETGLIERVRRRVSIGDGLAPSIAAGFLLVGGLLLALTERADPAAPRLTGRALRHVALSIAILALATILMRYAGPLAVEIANAVAPLAEGEPRSYRLLRDTAPWKYIGFVLGGGMLILGLIWQVERRIRWQALAVALLAALAMVAIYDLPFDDLLLPPNGDV